MYLKWPDRDELALVRKLIEEHVKRTQSPLGVKLLYRFDDIAGDFVKVIPREYEQMMTLTDKFEREGLAHEEAVERAFETMNAGE